MVHIKKNKNIHSESSVMQVPWSCCRSRKSLIWTAWVAWLLIALQQTTGQSSQGLTAALCSEFFFLPGNYDA